MRRLFDKEAAIMLYKSLLALRLKITASACRRKCCQVYKLHHILDLDSLAT